MNKQLKSRHVCSFSLALLLFCSPIVYGQDALLFEMPVEPIEESTVIGETILDPIEPETVLSIVQDDIVDAGLVDYTLSPAETLPVTETRIQDGQQKITITLDGVSLEDTMRLFAHTTGANFVVAPNMLTGLYVNVSLNDVDWIPALRSILEIHNFILSERTPGSAVFTVQRRGADAPEPTSIKTFFLDYTTASEVYRSVDEMLPPEPPPAEKEHDKRLKKYKALTFDSRNALVVRSTEKNMGEIEQLISELDRPGKQILVEAKILELSDEASKQLGIRWDSLEAFGVRAGLGPFTETRQEVDSLGRTSIDSRERNRQADFIDGKSRFTQRNSINEQFSLSNQSSLENSRNESSVSFPGGSSFLNSQNLASDLASSSSRNLSSTDNQGAASEFSESLTRLDRESFNSDIIDNFTRTINRQQNAILELDALQVVLSALEKTDGVSIISNPKMIIASGATNGFFKVGDREPIIRQEIKSGTTDSPGDRIVASLDLEITAEPDNRADFIRGGYLETGIELGVEATVKTDDFIEAFIRPVLRRRVGEKVVEGNSWPIISVKEIGTSFTLRSGQTVAIGGLTEVRDDKQATKVPVLGSVPVLGRLFSHTRDVKRQFETIIFVTLSVADPDNLERESGIPEDARLVHDRFSLMKALAAEATNQTNIEVQVDNKPITRGPRGPRR